jgi:hypothetical protein
MKIKTAGMMPPPPLKILNTPTTIKSKNTKFSFDTSQMSVDKNMQQNIGPTTMQFM